MNLYFVRSVDGLSLSFIGRLVMIIERDVMCSVGFHACQLVSSSHVVILHESMLEQFEDSDDAS